MQRLFAKTSRAIEVESREWVIRCGRCGAERSLWDAGGIRYKAAGRKHVLARCGACARLTWASINRRKQAT